MNETTQTNDVFDDPSFTHLLLTSELGPLNFNLSLDDVFKLLGKPYNVSQPYRRDRDGLDLINLFYDNLLVTFSDSKLRQVNIQFKKYEEGPKYTEKDCLPTPLQADWYSQVRQMDMDTFIQYVRDHGIQCQRLVIEGEEPCVLRLDRSGVEVIFEPECEYQIHQITVSTEGPGNRKFEDC